MLEGKAVGKKGTHNKTNVTESQMLGQNPPIICLQQIAALCEIEPGAN